jgi:Alpha/beta hydrolase domain
MKPHSIQALAETEKALNSDLTWLTRHGHVEREYLLSGTVSRYHLVDPNREAAVVDTGHPYSTRALVRHPSSSDTFNGTVVVEWLNVSSGQDIDFVYAATREEIVRSGYAWVGVTAQRRGAEQLTRWSPQRYAQVSLSATNETPGSGELLDPPAARTAASGGDVLCWDVFSQVAAALRTPGALLPNGFPVSRVLAAGESQSAFRLTSYHNCIQPLHGLYDGFLLYDRAGPSPLRTDLTLPVISLGTEFMSVYLGASPPDTRFHRWWELAGASHVSLQEMQDYVDPQVLRDGALVHEGRASSLTDTLRRESGDWETGLWSRVRNGDVMKAALAALNTWSCQGQPPPVADRLALDSSGRLVRDLDGQVSGGIRLADYVVPRAINHGHVDAGCALAGRHDDFDAVAMRQRYGSIDVYLERYAAALEVNVRAGFVLPEDAERALAQVSTQRSVGRHEVHARQHG